MTTSDLNSLGVLSKYKEFIKPNDLPLISILLL